MRPLGLGCRGIPLHWRYPDEHKHFKSRRRSSLDMFLGNESFSLIRKGYSRRPCLTQNNQFLHLRYPTLRKFFLSKSLG